MFSNLSWHDKKMHLLSNYRHFLADNNHGQVPMITSRNRKQGQLTSSWPFIYSKEIAWYRIGSLLLHYLEKQTRIDKSLAKDYWPPRTSKAQLGHSIMLDELQYNSKPGYWFSPNNLQQGVLAFDISSCYWKYKKLRVTIQNELENCTMTFPQ